MDSVLGFMNFMLHLSNCFNTSSTGLRIFKHLLDRYKDMYQYRVQICRTAVLNNLLLLKFHVFTYENYD